MVYITALTNMRILQTMVSGIAPMSWALEPEWRILMVFLWAPCCRPPLILVGAVLWAPILNMANLIGT